MNSLLWSTRQSRYINKGLNVIQADFKIQNKDKSISKSSKFRTKIKKKSKNFKIQNKDKTISKSTKFRTKIKKVTKISKCSTKEMKKFQKFQKDLTLRFSALKFFFHTSLHKYKMVELNNKAKSNS